VWPREVTLWPHLAHLLRGTPCLKARPGRGLGHSCVATCALTFLGELARIAQQVEQDSSLPPTDSTNLATPALRAVGGCFFRFFRPSAVRAARTKYLMVTSNDLGLTLRKVRSGELPFSTARPSAGGSCSLPHRRAR